jgi:hypothetical protein
MSQAAVMHVCTRRGNSSSQITTYLMPDMVAVACVGGSEGCG